MQGKEEIEDRGKKKGEQRDKERGARKNLKDRKRKNKKQGIYIYIVIDAPQSGLKGFSQTLNKLLRCATPPRCATAPTWQRPLASL